MRLAQQYWVILSVLCVAFMDVSAAYANGSQCHLHRLHIRTPAGEQSIFVELAQTEEKRAQGLMGRTSLPDRSGMLFLFPRSGPVAFWMKNTPLALDIIFITTQGRVARVHESARPFDLTPIPSGVPVQYVLEIPAGAAQKFGIGPGTIMRHAAFDQSQSIWPCIP